MKKNYSAPSVVLFPALTEGYCADLLSSLGGFANQGTVSDDFGSEE